MEDYTDIEDLFNEHQEAFTIYVVEQKFANDRGRKFFRRFINKENFISTQADMSKLLNRIINWIGKNLPNLKNIITDLLLNQKKAALNEIILTMSQAFTTYNHQAVGPEVIDPIIIQEGNISKKHLTQLVSLHQYSILQPTIIIILKDDNLKRARTLLQFCPNGMNVKLIRNNGEATIYKVVNSGVDDVVTFIDMFAMQCFSTCSHTERDVLLSDELLEDSIISYYSPLMFKIRSKLLYDDKNSCITDLNDIITGLKNYSTKSERELKLTSSFLCMAKLNRVFCRDLGGKDILDAIQIATELNNDLLLAHAYRYAYFIPKISESEQIPLLKTARNIFTTNKLVDHSIYCENNELILQFNSEKVEPRNFKHLADKAVNDVHGLVGTSHIYNNAGVAYLISGNSNAAIDYFDKGYKYAQREDRTVQRVAIQVNQMIAKSYSFIKIKEEDIILNMRQIFDGMGNELPYLSACYALNVLSVAFKQNLRLFKELLQLYPVEDLINLALSTNKMGSGPLVLQLKTLYNHNHNFDIINKVILPSELSIVSGRRAQFIERYGYNPSIFYVWI